MESRRAGDFITLKRFNTLPINQGDRLYISQHNRVTDYGYFIDVDEDQELLMLETDDETQITIPLAHIKKCKIMDTASGLVKLPKTKNGELIPAEERLRDIDKLLTPKGELDNYLSAMLDAYANANFDKMNNKERRKFNNYINQAWNILEELANHLLFINYRISKKFKILSSRTELRRNEPLAPFPNENIYGTVKPGDTSKTEIKQLYLSGVYENFQYTNKDFNMAFEDILGVKEKELLMLMGQKFTQEETAKIMGIGRSKVRTIRKNMKKKYEDFNAGKVAKNKVATPVNKRVLPIQLALPKGMRWICADEFFATKM